MSILIEPWEYEAELATIRELKDLDRDDRTIQASYTIFLSHVPARLQLDPRTVLRAQLFVDRLLAVNVNMEGGPSVSYNIPVAHALWLMIRLTNKELKEVATRLVDCVCADMPLLSYVNWVLARRKQPTFTHVLDLPVAR